MKNIIITGGAKRIGRALALEFARLNYNIAIIYNDSADMAKKTVEELKSIGVKALAYKCDLRISDEITNTFQNIYNDFDHIDILINNAGVFPKATKLEEISEEIWDDTLNVNLKATFRTSQEFAKREKDARIINIVSLGAFEIWKQRIPYNVSKTALLRLSESLARELAPNIAVNSVSPGTIIISNEKAVEPGMTDISKVPMRRLGNIYDVFSAVSFFATCSKFITGQNINVDGGYHLVK